MRDQMLINAIDALTRTLDSVIRSGDDDAKEMVLKKLLELVNKL